MDSGNILGEEALRASVSAYLGTARFEIVGRELRRASDGLIGFLGDHFRLGVDVEVEGTRRRLRLFIKTIPRGNPQKAEYISQQNFYKKECVMYKDVLAKFSGYEEPSPWRPNILHVTNEVVVMEDLAARGFATLDRRQCMNLEQCYAVMDSLAKLHSKTVLLQRRRFEETGNKFDVESKYPVLLAPNNFVECTWVTAGIRSLISFLGAFSTKYGVSTPFYDIVKTELPALFIEGCDRINKSDTYLNVFIHADLWSSNMLFRTNGISGKIDAVMVDYQCVKYAPGSVDVATLLYMNTDKVFRDKYEDTLLKHYRDVFNKETAHADGICSETLNWRDLKESYEHVRLFAFVMAGMLFPYTLVESGKAAEMFNDPETYQYRTEVDRSEQIIEVAKCDDIFRRRLLETVEEFIERYIIKTQ